MSLECTCITHGYCSRRDYHLAKIHFEQCQKGDVERLDILYDNLKNRPRAIVQETSQQVQERRIRVAEAKARNERLLVWIRSCQVPEDIGIGDTTLRLIIKAKQGSDIYLQLHRLLKTCNCRLTDAVKYLNQLHPYCTGKNTCQL